MTDFKAMLKGQPVTAAALRAHVGLSYTLDTETAMAPDCFKPGQWRLLQLYSDKGSLWLDIPTLNAWEMGHLEAFLEDPRAEITGHNLAFDYRVLLANGIRLRGQLFDTMIASQLLHQGLPKISHALKEVVRRELGVLMDKALQAQNWMTALLDAAELDYAMNDVKLTSQARDVLHEKIAAQGLIDTYNLECALIPATVSMEHHGLYLDPVAVGEAVESYKEESAACLEVFLDTLDSQLENAGQPRLPRHEDGTFNLNPKASGSVRLGTKKLAGFNIKSNAQLIQYFKYLDIEPCDEAKKPSLDKKVLAKHQSHELVRMLLAWRRVDKRVEMLQKLEEHCDADRRIRARFMPLATRSGRYSSSGPNLQNIPRDTEVRRCLAAPAGRCICQADYEAMEAKVAAAIAGETRMLEAFNSGVDIHVRSAALMYGIDESEVSYEQRRQAKALNFGALYSSGAKGIQEFCSSIGIFISFKEAFALLSRWHAAYPAFGRWHEKCQRLVDAGEPVRTRIGRRRILKGEDARVTVFANSWVQGTSADIVKCALVSIHDALPEGAFVAAQCHDEILVECDEEQGEEVLALMLQEMEHAAVPILGTAVRLTASGGVFKNWGDK